VSEAGSPRPGTPSLLRPGLVFAAALVVLALMAGRDLLGPSVAPHYAYVAQGWLHGRLSLDGEPPGYPRAHDDWAKVETLELTDEEVVRAYPCVTQACKHTRLDFQAELGTPVEAWWVLGDAEPRMIARRDVVDRRTTWFVSFPPGPAVFLLPLVLVFGLAAPEILLTAIAAALIPAVLLAWLDRRRPPPPDAGPWSGPALANVVAALALGLASPALVLGAHGRVWFTAQVIGCLFCTVYLVASDRAARPWLAGLALGIAVSCRPHLLLAAPLFLIAWWRGGKDPRKLVAFAIPLVVIGLLLATHNYARFGSPFEFGHRFLDIRWQTRMQQSGQFAAKYVGRNLRCALWLMPQLQPSWPFAKVSIHGMAAWLASPWLLAFFCRDTQATAPTAEPRWPFWLCAALVAAVPLGYHNSGQLQFSYRFALDWLPFVTAALALGGAFERRWVQVLVLAGVAINLHGAWWFDRSPQTLFVTDPLGWPFDHELRS